jgi:UDP-N-acetyl-D-mannosaminuronic acid transferase (WecB/TagA/CpsF family)
MQRAGLEWLHRLVRDPRRLSRRYLIDNPPVLLSLVREAFRVPKAQTVASGHSARAPQRKLK